MYAKLRFNEMYMGSLFFILEIHLENKLRQHCFRGTWTAAPSEDGPEMEISQLQDARKERGREIIKETERGGLCVEA